MSKGSRRFLRVAVSKEIHDPCMDVFNGKTCQCGNRVLVPTQDFERQISDSLKKKNIRAGQSLCKIGWNEFLRNKWIDEDLNKERKGERFLVETSKSRKPDTVILFFSNFVSLQEKVNFLVELGKNQNHFPKRVVIILPNGTNASQVTKLFGKVFKDNVDARKSNYYFYYDKGRDEDRDKFIHSLKKEENNMSDYLIVLENSKTHTILRFIDMIVANSPSLPRSISVLM